MSHFSCRLRIFYFVEKLCSVLKIFKFLYFWSTHDLTNLCDVMMSISTFLSISYLNIILIVLSLGFKQNKHKYDLHNMMMSQILKSVDFTKTHKSRYFGFMVKPQTSDIGMTYEWHRDDIRVHTSDIGMAYQWHRDGIRVHTSDIRMTYEWHRDGIRVHTSDIRMTYEWHRDDKRVHTSDINDLQVICEYIGLTCE